MDVSQQLLRSSPVDDDRTVCANCLKNRCNEPFFPVSQGDFFQHKDVKRYMLRNRASIRRRFQIAGSHGAAESSMVGKFVLACALLRSITPAANCAMSCR
jgi:hypothetical protein